MSAIGLSSRFGIGGALLLLYSDELNRFLLVFFEWRAILDKNAVFMSHQLGLDVHSV